MGRTNAAAVALLLGKDYDGTTDLQQHIDTVSATIMANMIACAGRKRIVHSAEQLEIVERWLAAWSYCLMDKTFANDNAGKSAASYQGQTGKGLEINYYGQNALRLDQSGCLEAIDKRKVASAVWLGKPKSQQTPYDERN